jgi:dynein heavy chain
MKVIKTVMAAVCVMKDIKPEKILDPDGSGKKVIHPKFKSCIYQ